MFGTLIGLFITSTAIVIGADRAVLEGNKTGNERLKICQSGAASVATIQGNYEIPLKGSEPVRLWDIFMQECANQASSKERKSIDAQADAFIKKLQDALQPYVNNLAEEALAAIIKENGHVNYISVSGYVDGAPRALVRRLKLERNKDGQWETMRYDSSDRSPTHCGARFHGDRGIAEALVLNIDPRKFIPSDVFQRSEVIAVQKVEGKKNCSPFTPEHAEQLFKMAVRLTIDLGDKIKIPAGRVGGTLDLWSISPDGKVCRQEVPKGK